MIYLVLFIAGCVLFGLSKMLKVAVAVGGVLLMMLLGVLLLFVLA